MNRVGLPCKFCEKPLSPHVEKKNGIPYYGRNRGAGFCSLSCWYEYTKSTKKRQKRRICRVCGKDFFSNLKTCSKPCGYAFRKMTTVRISLICLECSASFIGQTRKAKFCSNLCRITYNRAMIEKECLICSKKFKRTWGAIKRTTKSYCSTSCAKEGSRGEQHYNWRGGHDPNRGPSWIRLAATIRERDNFKCRRCRKTQKENGQKLSVDHIFPWRMFANKEEANNPNNLVALCRSCHAWKTISAEAPMLRGDNINFEQYRKAISLE